MSDSPYRGPVEVPILTVREHPLHARVLAKGTGEVCPICRYRQPVQDRSCCETCMPVDDAARKATDPTELRKATEAALLRSRRGWTNAMELGILDERYHEEANSIVQELTVALVAIGSKEAI